MTTALPVPVPTRVSRRQRGQEVATLPPDVDLEERESGIHIPTKINRKGKKGAEVKHGPSQIPIEEQSGVYLDRSVLEGLERDSLGRDVFTKEERIREWEETEALYFQHKDAPLPIDSEYTRMTEFGIHLVGGDMGQGKSMPPGQLLVTYSGALKKAKDVVPGDLLMGPDSKPRTVLSTHQGNGPMCRITPVKGEPWECNDVHMLTLVRVREAASKRKTRDREGEIVDIQLDEYMHEWSGYKKSIHKLFRVGVEFPWQPELPIEPYLLGLFLGDGTMTDRSGLCITVANTDTEIAEYCHVAAEKWGGWISVRKKSRSDAAFDYHFAAGRGRDGKTLKEALREVNALNHYAHDKYVPSAYRTASRADRLELLAGLMDSDGHLEQGVFDYSTKSIALADDLAFVARSVGLAAYVSAKELVYNGKIRDFWRVCISGDIDQIPCKLPRKQAAPRQQKKNVLRTGFTVEEIGDGDYYGFTLDGDGRFLLGDFTVTHNTLFCTLLARHWRRRGWNIFSTAGFLFGQRLRLVEAYSFPDHITPGGLVFPDEVHTLVDRYSANSVRSRTFGQSSTAMRKERITCLGASAHTIMVGWEYKGVSESVIVPRRWYPSGKLHAPPFCYIEIVKLHPFPYRRKDQLLMDAGLVRGIDQKKSIWRPSPQEVMGAAKLMDSFESVKIGENFGLGSQAMREEREGRGGEGGQSSSGGQPNLVWVVKRVWEAGYIAEGQPVYFTTIRDVIKQAGLNVSSTQIRSALEMAGCPVKGATVHEDDLRALFDGIDNERAPGVG